MYPTLYPIVLFFTNIFLSEIPSRDNQRPSVIGRTGAVSDDTTSPYIVP